MSSILDFLRKQRDRGITSRVDSRNSITVAMPICVVNMYLTCGEEGSSAFRSGRRWDKIEASKVTASDERRHLEVRSEMKG